MALEFHPLSKAVGARVTGLDLTRPYDAATTAQLRRAFLQYHLLLVRGSEIAEEDEVRFSELFGPVSRRGDNMKHGGKVMRISNAHADGAFPTGELLFHSDHVFFEHPLKAIALYGEQVPSRGGETLFSNAAAAWDALPTALQDKVRHRNAINVYDYSVNAGNRRFDPASVSPDAPRHVHPIAWRHPETDRIVLFVNPLMTAWIEGMDADESDRTLKELFGYIQRPELIYQHQWQLHDLVLWDNRVLQHARTDFDPAEKRVLRRVPIAENEVAAVA
jgi:taurine dioxygenase